METRIVKVNRDNPEVELIKEGAELIKSGKLVAFPTETVYGLGANGLDEEAASKIFVAKGRPQDNPLILHVSSLEEVKQLVKSIPKQAEIIAEKFWPGPLTMIFERSSLIPDVITAGLDTVAIRMPDHKIALELIRASGVPIAAPSANTSGRPSPTIAQHVIEDLYGKIDMIIDGGATGVGLESTVLDLTGELPTILRPGGVTLEDLKPIIPDVTLDLSIVKDEDNIIPKSPGQKYRHYAPKAHMIVYCGQVDDIVEAIKNRAKELIEEGKTVGIMATDETKSSYQEGMVVSVGSRKDMGTIAHNLFNVLRNFDEKKVDIILSEGVEMEDLGTAIMNRMKKASGGNIIYV
ncbi:MAG: threonylcarbamoyl-AMP synthase [Tissierellia bacterium]|nr:threonylcarbamoyl-AMP synthase [Tissierellia bacterium]